MIIEAIIFGAVPAIMTWNLFKEHQISKAVEKDFKQRRTAEENTPISDLAAMVIELLKEDEGWLENKRGSLTHATGISLKQVTSLSLEVFVNDTSGVGTKADVTSLDQRRIIGEINSFKSRREAAKQRALTRTVAERIVALRNGTIRPVLGNDEDGAADDDSVGGSDPVPALYFDARTNRIVALGTRDAGKLTLDSTFVKRYKLGYFEK